MTGDPAYVWPTFEDIEVGLARLASRLYGSPEQASPSFRIESRALLESALGLPHQPYYETFAEKLAALVRSIACNHALADGNKRLAMTVLHSTLVLNGYVWLWSSEDAAHAILRAASGDSDFRWLAEFIELFTAPSTLPLSTFSLDELVRAWPQAVERGWHESAPGTTQRRPVNDHPTDGPTYLRERPAVFVADSAVHLIRDAISCLAHGKEREASEPVRGVLAAMRQTVPAAPP